MYDALMKATEAFLIAYTKELIKFIYDTVLSQVESMINDFIADFFLDKIFNFIPHDYCHIGGLYVINEFSDKFFHCKDFYNKDVTRNWEIHFGNVDKIPYFFNNHNYLTEKQNPMERCQENRKRRLLNELI